MTEELKEIRSLLSRAEELVHEAGFRVYEILNPVEEITPEQIADIHAEAVKQTGDRHRTLIGSQTDRALAHKQDLAPEGDN